MYPVLKIMHILNFLDTFSVGVTTNKPAGTFRSTAEDVSPPHWKSLPIIKAFSTTVEIQPFSPDKSVFMLT